MIQPISLRNSVEYFCSDTIPKVAKSVYDFAHHILSNYYYVMPGIALTLGHYNDMLISSLVCAHDSVNWLVDNETLRSVSSLTFIIPVTVSLAIRISRFVITGTNFNAISVLLQVATLAKLLIIKNAEGRSYE